MPALVPPAAVGRRSTPTFQPIQPPFITRIEIQGNICSICSMPYICSAYGKLGFELQELQRTFRLFSDTRHAGRFSSALATCVPSARQGARVPSCKTKATYQQTDLRFKNGSVR
jgi:hypothetical protein